MKKTLSLGLLVLVLVGGFFYTRINTYGYHLNQARNALTQLELTLQGQAPKSAFIPAAFAQAGTVSIDETAVSNLTQTVVDETEKAIEIVDNKTAPAELASALTEVQTVQAKTVSVLSDAIEVVQAPETVQVVSQAIQSTASQQTQVADAIKIAETASATGSKEVAVNIVTTAETQAPAVAPVAPNDAELLAKANAAYDSAKALFEQLKASGASAEELAKLQSKLDKIAAALTAGDLGRAFGLSTAIQAKANEFLRESQKESEDGSDQKDQNKEEDKKEGNQQDQNKQDENKQAGDKQNEDLNKDGQKTPEGDQKNNNEEKNSKNTEAQSKSEESSKTEEVEKRDSTDQPEAAIAPVTSEKQDVETSPRQRH